MSWIARPDLNFCPECWFSARIESKEREIGTQYLCHSCGCTFPFFDDVPVNMTDEQFKIYHKKYVKKRYGDV